MSIITKKSKLEKFGQAAIKAFKDEQIDYISSMMNGISYGTAPKKFITRLKQLDEDTRQIILACVTEATIGALVFFLNFLEESSAMDIGISVCVDGEDLVDLAVDDDLHSMPYGDGGWEAKFSQHPKIDDIYARYKSENDEAN